MTFTKAHVMLTVKAGDYTDQELEVLVNAAADCAWPMLLQTMDSTVPVEVGTADAHERLRVALKPFLERGEIRH